MKYLKYLFIFFLIFLIGCSSNTNKEDEREINLDSLKAKYEILVGEEVELDEKIEDKVITYLANSDLITINNNKVKAIAPGKVVIEAKVGEVKKDITIVISGVPTFSIDVTEFNVNLNEEFEIKVTKEYIDTLDVTYDSNAFSKNGDKYKALQAGTFKITYKYQSQSIECTVNVKDDSEFTCPDTIEIYVTEEKEIDITVIKGNVKDLEITPKTTNLAVDGYKVKGIEEGVGVLEIKLNSFKKSIEVNVKELSITIYTTDIEVDYFETADFEFDYPEFLNDELEISISDESIFKLENGKIIPLKAGKTRIKLSMKANADIYKSTTVTVTVDPEKILNMLKRDEVLMRKEVNTYGNTVMTQSVMGSVFKIYFGSLNLTVDYVPLSSDKYVGQVATPELIASLDEKGLIRTGIKLEAIKYITYHDTGNNTKGAGALNNITYMKGDYNKSTRARSWHYTVDDTGVWQTIPDDEVSWQGDTYGSYATSIGIETCVNYGVNLDIVWHRMGKLCGSLLYAYNLDISAVKQHYDWNQKNCPQTLRRNNLYGYAKEMIEAELLINNLLGGYSFTFKSLSPEFLDNTGQIIKNPTQTIEVEYEIRVTNKKGYDSTFTFKSTVNPLS